MLGSHRKAHFAGLLAIIKYRQSWDLLSPKKPWPMRNLQNNYNNLSYASSAYFLRSQIYISTETISMIFFSSNALRTSCFQILKFSRRWRLTSRRAAAGKYAPNAEFHRQIIILIWSLGWLQTTDRKYPRGERRRSKCMLGEGRNDGRLTYPCRRRGSMGVGVAIETPCRPCWCPPWGGGPARGWVAPPGATFAPPG